MNLNLKSEEVFIIKSDTVTIDGCITKCNFYKCISVVWQYDNEYFKYSPDSLCTYSVYLALSRGKEICNSKSIFGSKERLSTLTLKHSLFHILSSYDYSSIIYDIEPLVG